MPFPGNTSSSGKKPTPAPLIGSPSPGINSASVPFTVPAWQGKGTITYFATSSPGGIQGTNTTTPISVTGLTAGQPYTFVVNGITNYGVASDTSGAGGPVTPIAPPPSFPSFTIPSFPSFTLPSFPSFTLPSFPSFTLPSFPSFSLPSFPSFSAPSFPSFPSFSLPSFPSFSLPSFPSFSLPSFPSFNLPSFPSFNLPSFPSFNLPSFPSFTASPCAGGSGCEVYGNRCTATNVLYGPCTTVGVCEFNFAADGAVCFLLCVC